MNDLSMRTLIRTFITHPLVHIHQKTKIAAKIENLHGHESFFNMVVTTNNMKYFLVLIVTIW